MIKILKNWKNNNIFSNPLVNVLIDFYYVISENYLASGDFDKEKYQKTLRKLNDTISNINISDTLDNQKQKSLKSMIIQETALDLTRRGKEAQSDINKINLLFDESLKLKQECNDLVGIAINYGSRGSFYLYTMNDYENSRHYFIKDVDLVNRMGDEGARAGLLNKLAMCDWLESENINDDNKVIELKESAFDLAYQSYKNAMFLKRETDTVFACLSIFNYSNKSKEDHLEIINSVGEEINNKDIWDEISSPYIKNEMLKSIIGLGDKKNNPWIDSLKIKLEKK